MNENMNERTITCENCGIILKPDEAIEYNGHAYCPDCADELDLVKCEDCGEWMSRDDAVEYAGNIYICSDCADRRGLVQCHECGEWFDPREGGTDDVVTRWRHKNYALCDHCLGVARARDLVMYCDCCNDYFDTNDLGYTVMHNGDILCEDCAGDNAYYCEGCGEYFYDDEIRWCEEDDSYYCRSCYPDRPRSIHDYGFKPYPCFHGVNRDEPRFGDPLTLGWELEVDNGDDRYDCANEIANAFDEDTLYMKNDSSVDFEIVTHPHTLEAYKAFDFAKLCRIPTSYGYKSHNAGTCGFHIHVGRAQLADTKDNERKVVNKIALLMWRHWDSLVRFSRRNESQLNRWASRPDFEMRSEMTEDEVMSAIDSTYRYHDRYRALNCENRGTIEFRLWRGSLKPETLLATIQLTSNICRYAMEHSVSEVLSSSWQDITGFETCPELEGYLTERELVEGCAPKGVTIVAPKPEPVPTENIGGGKYKVGDTVQIVSTGEDGLVIESMLGARGTIADITPGLEADRYLLLISYEHSPDGVSDFTHFAGGRATEGNGYWVEAQHIALTDYNTGATIGDHVRIMSGMNRGVTGTLVAFSGPEGFNRPGSPIVHYGVAMDERYADRAGHDLNGMLPEQYDRTCGWWTLSIEVLSSVALNNRAASGVDEAACF